MMKSFASGIVLIVLVVAYIFSEIIAVLLLWVRLFKNWIKNRNSKRTDVEDPQRIESEPNAVPKKADSKPNRLAEFGFSRRINVRGVNNRMRRGYTISSVIGQKKDGNIPTAKIRPSNQDQPQTDEHFNASDAKETERSERAWIAKETKKPVPSRFYKLGIEKRQEFLQHTRKRLKQGEQS